MTGNALSRVTNATPLPEILGYWPSFHDAEVIKLRLDRDGSAGAQLEAEVHVFEMTADVTPDGFYRRRYHTLATLLFSGIDELSLDDFNHQNVLSGLSLVDLSERQPDTLRWE